MKRSLVNFDLVNPGNFGDNAEPEARSSHSLTCYRQGEALANVGKYAEALISFNQAVALRPNDDAAWVFRAVVLIHLGQYQEALQSCDRAIAICSTNSEAWTFRGVALHRMGYYSEAYASYDRAVGKLSVSPWQKWRRRGLNSFRKASL